MKLISLSFVIVMIFVPAVFAENLFAIYGQVQEAWKNKDNVKVLQLVEQMVAIASDNSSIQYEHARALLANGKPDQALSVLHRIVQIGGSPPARNDERMSALKENPEFQKILSEFDKNRMTQGRSKVAFVIPGKELIPEGIAYDPVDRKFYIGSLYLRKIIQVDADGKSSDFKTEKQDGLWGMVGMEVDSKRRLLWANTANGGARNNMSIKDPEAQTEGKTAVLKYDLRTGNLLKKYEIGSNQDPKFLNDVAITSNGDVYISESGSGEIYRITSQKDTLELMIPSGSMSFPNGLAVSSDDRYLYIAHVEGITVVDLQDGSKQLLAGPENSQLGNHDGLVFYKNSLIGIQGLTGEVDRIARFELENPKRVRKVEVLQVNHPLFVLPTTGDMAGDEFYYIANSQIRSFDEKGKVLPPEKLNDTVILKVDLLESEKEELRAVHEKGKKAHLLTDVDLLLTDSPDEFTTVSRGKINKVTPADERKMFEEYFRGAKYTVYEDLEPPIITVSDDGMSGWVISRTQVKRTQEGKSQEFVYAGIMTYEKQNGKWIRTANVSTFEM